MKKIIPLTLILLLVDQVIKYIVKTNMNIYESIEVIKDFFSITYVHNTGAAFSILSGHIIFFVVIAILAIIGIYYFFIKESKLKKIDIIVYSMLYAGIIGNLIDRIFLGYVIDYLDFYIFNYDAPIFNFADTLIVIATFIFIIITWKEEAK